MTDTSSVQCALVDSQGRIIMTWPTHTLSKSITACDEYPPFSISKPIWSSIDPALLIALLILTCWVGLRWVLQRKLRGFERRITALESRDDGGMVTLPSKETLLSNRAVGPKMYRRLQQQARDRGLTSL